MNAFAIKSPSGVIDCSTIREKRDDSIKSFVLKNAGVSWDAAMKLGYKTQPLALVLKHTHLGYAEHLVMMAARFVRWYAEHAVRDKASAAVSEIISLADRLEEVSKNDIHVLNMQVREQVLPPHEIRITKNEN